MSVRKYLALGAVVAGGGTLLAPNIRLLFGDAKDDGPDFADHVPSRAQQLSRLKECSKDKPFDLLIIGGGATGAGCAADAATRGLRTVLIERDDFGSGTSSKSTKLVHGGVRYLEKAVWGLDYSQLKLVWSALHERLAFLRNAPHLTYPVPILTPCYNLWEVPYFWAGLKAYDLVAGRNGLIMSKFTNSTESLTLLPTLAAESPVDGKTLKGAILYYDGAFDDARMNVTLACTAAAAGGVVANHMECMQLLKNKEGAVVGARCRDVLSGEVLDVYAKVLINATGTLSDSVRKLSDSAAATCVTGSSGAHVALPSFYGSATTGLIIPKTRDGRVLFMLPWQGHLIAGTTDNKCDVNPKRKPTEEEVIFILDSLSDFLGVKVLRSDVMSAWCGVRPLPSDPTKKDTQSIVRDHIIFTDKDGMVTVTGGKWTTYRLMAEEAVDAAVATGRLPLNISPCRTIHMHLVGGQDYKPTLHAEIAQQYSKSSSSSSSSRAPSTSASPAPAPAGQDLPSSLDVDGAVAFHLAHSYGDRAPQVLALAASKGLGTRLVPRHPILEAEVAYCAQHEYCETVDDFLERRTRLAFVDSAAALAAVPRVAEIMAAQLGWSRERKVQEQERATAILQQSFVPAP